MDRVVNMPSKLSQAINERGIIIRSNTEAIKDDTSIMRDEIDLAKHRDVIAWISSTNFPAQQSDFISRVQEGTGQWFLAAPEIAQWLGQSNPTLFCPGIPGAGKTTIAAITINHLLKTVQSDSIGVAYVYCNYKAREQDATSLLAAILKQLIQTQPSLSKPIEELYNQHSKQGTRPLADDIFTALQLVLESFSAAYVIIDALDECPDNDGTRHHFLAKLRDLQAKTKLRLMATSRFIPGIMDEFKDALNLEIQASEEDVKRFIAGQIYRLPKCIQRDTALQNLIQEKILAAVDGM